MLAEAGDTAAGVIVTAGACFTDITGGPVDCVELVGGPSVLFRDIVGCCPGDGEMVRTIAGCCPGDGEVVRVIAGCCPVLKTGKGVC